MTPKLIEDFTAAIQSIHVVYNAACDYYTIGDGSREIILRGDDALYFEKDVSALVAIGVPADIAEAIAGSFCL